MTALCSTPTIRRRHDARVARVSHSRLAVESPIFTRVGNMSIMCVYRSRPELMNANPSELTIRFDSNESHPTTLHVPRYMYLGSTHCMCEAKRRRVWLSKSIDPCCRGVASACIKRIEAIESKIESDSLPIDPPASLLPMPVSFLCKSHTSYYYGLMAAPCLFSHFFLSFFVFKIPLSCISVFLCILPFCLDRLLDSTRLLDELRELRVLLRPLTPTDIETKHYPTKEHRNAHVCHEESCCIGRLSALAPVMRGQPRNDVLCIRAHSHVGSVGYLSSSSGAIICDR